MHGKALNGCTYVNNDEKCIKLIINLKNKNVLMKPREGKSQNRQNGIHSCPLIFKKETKKKENNVMPVICE